eukprot:5323270-Prymnesium_polylepis.1
MHTKPHTSCIWDGAGVGAAPGVRRAEGGRGKADMPHAHRGSEEPATAQWAGTWGGVGCRTKC